MRVALPEFNAAQAREMFSGIAVFLCEGADPGTLVRLAFDGARVLASTSKVG